MKFACLIVLAMMLSWCLPARAQSTNVPSTSTEEEIKSIEEERNRAILSGDAATLDRMTADDYTFITLREKQGTLGDSGPPDYAHPAIDEFRLMRVIGILRQLLVTTEGQIPLYRNRCRAA